MILLEVSVVVFLLHGYLVTGKEVGGRGEERRARWALPALHARPLAWHLRARRCSFAQTLAFIKLLCALHAPLRLLVSSCQRAGPSKPLLGTHFCRRSCARCISLAALRP